MHTTYQQYTGVMPRQNLPIKEKLKKREDGRTWGMDCVDAGINLCFTDSYRQGLPSVLENYELYEGIIELDDKHPLCKLLGVRVSEAQKLTLFNPIKYIVNTLTNESRNIVQDYTVMTINEDAIISKLERKKAIIGSKIAKLIQTAGLDPKTVEMELARLQTFLKYDFRDDKELIADVLLRSAEQSCKSKINFDIGARDLFISGYDAHKVEVKGKKVVHRAVNPLFFQSVLSSNSNRFSDAIVLVEKFSKSFSEVMADYNLTKDEQILLFGYEDEKMILARQLFRVDTDPTYYNHPFGNQSYISAGIDGLPDAFGNIDVHEVTFLSLRKMIKRKFYDEFGNEQESIEDENYKIDKDAGEEAEEIWIKEYWEGTRIGESVYRNIRPKEEQFRSIDDLNDVKSGFFGGIMSSNPTFHPKGLISEIKGFIYLYNIFMIKLMHAYKNTKGHMPEINISKIPTEFKLKGKSGFKEYEEFADALNAYYIDPSSISAEAMSVGVQPFYNTERQIQKGSPELLSMYHQFLSYITQQIHTMTGVDPSRVASSMTAPADAQGLMEQNIGQSLNATRHWFNHLEETKREVREGLIYASKHAVKRGSKLLKNILDDQQYHMLMIDSDDFMDSDYGIYLSGELKDQSFFMSLSNNSRAMLEQGLISFGDLMEIQSATSISAMKRKIAQKEEEGVRRIQENAQAAQKLEQEKFEFEKTYKLKEQEFRGEEIKLAIDKLAMEKDYLNKNDANMQLNRLAEIDKINAKGGWDMKKLEAEMEGSIDNLEAQDNSSESSNIAYQKLLLEQQKFDHKKNQDALQNAQDQSSIRQRELEIQLKNQ